MYALFSQGKPFLVMLHDMAVATLDTLSNMHMALASQQSSLKQEISIFLQDAYEEKAALYQEMRDDPDNQESIKIEIQQIDSEIAAAQQENQRETEGLAMQETSIEKQEKAQETLVSLYKEKLQAYEEAEKEGVEDSTPNFTGLG